MAYTLNTGHALYSNLIELIGVQGGALVSHKTARTFTKHAEASYGTGTYGEHFTSVDGTYTAKGASFTPSIDIDTVTNVNYTVFIAFNARTTSGGSAGYLAKDTNSYSLCSPVFTAANKVGVYQGYTNRFTGATTVGTGAQSVGITRAGDGAANGLKLYENGVFDSQNTTEYGNATAGINYLGGYAGQGSVGASVVWIAVFDKALNSTEIADLHNSLGASNTFGLIASSGTSYSVTLDTGTYIATGQALSTPVNLSSVLNSGSYTISGQQVILSNVTPGSYSLQLEYGNYTLTYIDPNVDLVGLLDSGIYNLLGSSVRLMTSQDLLVTSKSTGLFIGTRIGI